MDQQIIWETFTHCLRCADILDIDDPVVGEVKNALSNLAETKIASDGRLMEWAEALPLQHQNSALLKMSIQFPNLFGSVRVSSHGFA